MTEVSSPTDVAPCASNVEQIFHSRAPSSRNLDAKNIRPEQQQRQNIRFSTSASTSNRRNSSVNNKRGRMSVAVGKKPEKFALPTHFLLGGNINDPLNLSSIGAGSSPQQASPSPYSTPNYNSQIEIVVPKDRRDPLNLDSGPPQPKKRKIVDEAPSASPAKTSASSAKFRYGNYNRYYGKRAPEGADDDDPRLALFDRELFENKDVLDVGCNIGAITLFVAKNLRPRRIVGVDIDGNLIGVARKNVRRYLDSTEVEQSRFPASFSRQYGPASAPSAGCSNDSTKFEFPRNVLFKTGNFVPDDERALDSTNAEYDVVLALSITKWIHLNWGDDGLKRFFKRLYKCLKPGGVLILEPQPFVSYKKRKRLTPEIFQNYENIKFKPDQFTEYLLSLEVGFNKSEVMGTPLHKSQGFCRPLYKFTKPVVERVVQSQQEEKTKKDAII